VISFLFIRGQISVHFNKGEAAVLFNRGEISVLFNTESDFSPLRKWLDFMSILSCPIVASR
jgi:hypothetical protein